MKRFAFVAAVGLTFGCIMSLICVRPVQALLFAVGAGAVFAWIETVEQREFRERMSQKYGGDWSGK